MVKLIEPPGRIELAGSDRPRFRREPVAQMLGCGPGFPDEFDRNIDLSFEHQIEFRIDLDHG
jgi:hypothetical protein